MASRSSGNSNLSGYWRNIPITLNIEVPEESDFGNQLLE
jgi:hypothetical protein